MAFENPLRAAWARGEVVRGAWCASPSAVVAETLASVGYDYVCADLQHGAVDYSDAVHMLQAISGQGATPIVRCRRTTRPRSARCWTAARSASSSRW